MALLDRVGDDVGAQEVGKQGLDRFVPFLAEPVSGEDALELLGRYQVAVGERIELAARGVALPQGGERGQPVRAVAVAGGLIGYIADRREPAGDELGDAPRI